MKDDIEKLNNTLNEYDIEVFLSDKKEFLQNADLSSFIAFIIILKESILSGIMYDSIKYAIFYILSKIKNNKKTKSTTVEITLNGKKDIIEFSFELNETQKEKIVDASIKRLLSNK
jgi:hypothetical protein